MTRPGERRPGERPPGERPSGERPSGERRHEPLLPGFREMAARRKALSEDLLARRVSLGLTQTQVAAKMGTSQSAVARVEAGGSDVRLSTVERYAAAVGQVVEWSLGEPDTGAGSRSPEAGRAGGGSGPFAGHDGSTP